jgi:2-amino-4-hydroxy-6-hydroxymethyldihydropteridine diphosphokinase
VRAWVPAFVALGANLGDAAQAVRAAIAALEALPEGKLTAASSLYTTAPVDSSGPDYVNAVVRLETGLTAPGLLHALQQIEADAGRTRPWRHAPRTLDLDLLLYGSAQIHSPQLEVPHPRMLERAFVLVPLAEIAPDLVDPEPLARVSFQAISRLQPSPVLR